MKKKAVLITAFIALISLTSCGALDENNTIMDSEIAPSLSSDVSETIVSDNPESEAETAPAETNTESVSETSVSENKTEGTKTAETKTEEKKDDKSNTDNSEKQDFSAISGKWYEKDAYRPRVISVNDDGIFKVTDESPTYNIAEGSVFRMAENGKDWYHFIDADRGLWYKFEVVTANGVTELVSEDNALDRSYYFSRIPQDPKPSPNPGAVPNEYGFCKVTDPPSTSISVASLAGTWQNTDYPDEKMVITATDDLYYGKFTYYNDNGTELSGYICYEFPWEIPFSAETDCFTFYNEEGSLVDKYDVTGEIPLNDLWPYEENAGGHHMVRVE